MAWTSWTAALCFLMMWPVLAGQAPAMCVQESGAPQRRQAGVDWSPYRCAILPLYSCPHRNFRSCVAWAGLEERLLVIWEAVVASRAPFLEAWRIRRLYREVWYRLLSTLGLTLLRNCFEGLVKA